MGSSIFSDERTHPVEFFIQAVEIIWEPTFLGSALKTEKPEGMIDIVIGNIKRAREGDR